MSKQTTTTLKIYKAKSGQWAGIMFDGDTEIGRVAGLESPGEVEECAAETGYFFDVIEMQTKEEPPK